MKLIIIERKGFTVAAYIQEAGDGNESLPAMNDLIKLGSKYQGSAKGVASLYKIFAEHGRLRPHGVTKEQMHHANYDPDIFEFIKGDVRVFCFLDGNMVILTNAGLKKGQKANPKDVAKAEKVYRQYFKDKNQGNIELRERKKS